MRPPPQPRTACCASHLGVHSCRSRHRRRRRQRCRAQQYRFAKSGAGVTPFKDIGIQYNHPSPLAGVAIAIVIALPFAARSTATMTQRGVATAHAVGGIACPHGGSHWDLPHGSLVCSDNRSTTRCAICGLPRKTRLYTCKQCGRGSRKDRQMQVSILGLSQSHRALHVHQSTIVLYLLPISYFFACRSQTKHTYRCCCLQLHQDLIGGPWQCAQRHICCRGEQASYMLR